MTGSVALLLVSFLLAPGPSAEPAAQGSAAPAVAPITGVVRDTGGGVIGGALVTARVASGAERQTSTDGEGKFSLLPPAAGDLTIVVRVNGFAEWRRPLAATANRQIEVTLEAAGQSETV